LKKPHACYSLTWFPFYKLKYHHVCQAFKRYQFITIILYSDLFEYKYVQYFSFAKRTFLMNLITNISKLFQYRLCINAYPSSLYSCFFFCCNCIEKLSINHDMNKLLAHNRSMCLVIRSDFCTLFHISYCFISSFFSLYMQWILKSDSSIDVSCRPPIGFIYVNVYVSLCNQWNIDVHLFAWLKRKNDSYELFLLTTTNRRRWFYAFSLFLFLYFFLIWLNAPTISPFNLFCVPSSVVAKRA
jgi:hypothetical protein